MPEDLAARLDGVCVHLAPVPLHSLQLARLGRFFALIAPDEHAALRRVADAAVTELDDFRASPDAAELERRRVGCLTDRQEALLNRWGYPYVMEEFRFHLTLTGPVRDPDAVEEVLQMVLADRLETPLALDALSLCGEGEDGFFREVARFPLRG